jgi:hypothetical protein
VLKAHLLSRGCDHHAGRAAVPSVTRTAARSKATGTTRPAPTTAPTQLGHLSEGGVGLMQLHLRQSLDRFSGGTGGTGGTAQDLVRAGGTAARYRWDRRAERTKRHHDGPTGPTVRYHQKSAELPAVPPVPPAPRGSGAFVSKQVEINRLACSGSGGFRRGRTRSSTNCTPLHHRHCIRLLRS